MLLVFVVTLLICLCWCLLGFVVCGFVVCCNSVVSFCRYSFWRCWFLLECSLAVFLWFVYFKVCLAFNSVVVLWFLY